MKNLQKINIEKSRKTIKTLDPQVLAHCVRNTERSKKLVLTEFLKFQNFITLRCENENSVKVGKEQN